MFLLYIARRDLQNRDLSARFYPPTRTQMMLPMVASTIIAFHNSNFPGQMAEGQQQRGYNNNQAQSLARGGRYRPGFSFLRNSGRHRIAFGALPLVAVDETRLHGCGINAPVYEAPTSWDFRLNQMPTGK